jgi:hypothetical protein
VTAARPPQIGNLIWTELEDANGFRKVRPAVIVTSTADIAAGHKLRVVAVTTSLPDPLPDDHILLPWDRQGKARSGLKRKCAAVTSWQADITKADVREIVGILPPAVIDRLLAKIAEAAPSPSDDEESRDQESKDE